MQMVEEIKRLFIKYCGEQKVCFKGQPHFEDFVTDNEDVLLLSAYQDILEGRGEENPYLTAIYNTFKENPHLLEADDEESSEDTEGSEDTEDPALSSSFGGSDEEPEEDEELGKNEETFANKYPEVDEEETLKKVYDEWLDAVSNKPFYKTIEAYYQSSQAGTLNYMDRSFLWKLIKSISSCITHLFIEGEQKEESLCLVDRYYDSLVQCLNSVVHANAKEDVANAFLYMVDLLNLEGEDEGDTNNSEEEDKF